MSYFSDSDPDSMQWQIFQSAILQPSFKGLPFDLMNLTLKQPNTCYLDQVADVISYTDFVCELELVWQFQIYDATFGVTKGFPYTPFLNHALTKLRESGSLSHFLQVHKVLFPECTKSYQDLVSMSPKKVVVVFLIMLLGLLLGALIGFVENKLPFRL